MDYIFLVSFDDFHARCWWSSDSTFSARIWTTCI